MTSRHFTRVSILIYLLPVGLFLASCATSKVQGSNSLRGSVIEDYDSGSEGNVAGSFSGTSAVAPSFDWPVDEARLTRGYKTTPTGKRHKPHLGIDLAAPKGTPILASHSGTIIYAGRDFRGYGRMVMIEGKNGIATLYAHLERTYVTEGQKVIQGETIAGMGRTGRASGVHLHFEIRKESGPVDPLEYLPNGVKYAHLLTAHTELKDNFRHSN